MKGKSFVAIVVLLAALFLVTQSLFVVDQAEQAIVIQLGKPLEGTYQAGLHWKIPFIQEVIRFEKRILLYDSDPTEILTKDKKNLLVDNYAKWVIREPLTYYKSVRNETGAQLRLDDIVYAQLRVELGRHTMEDIVSTTRNDIMTIVTQKSDELARAYGIDVVDVRIKRADLPEQNEKSVFERMRAERERQAKQYRSEGEEESLKIRAAADRDREIILAKAYEEAEKMKGEGDSQSIRIYGEAYGQDPEFFEFYRTMEAYRKALKTETTLVATPGEEFFRYLEGRKEKPAR
ncbi:MAG TPA: protease modulator HflC [Syntrophales bacterium]|mgnify:CR=1 FL=1|nr:protease modulator HflC [Syntrophales bacterium]